MEICFCNKYNCFCCKSERNHIRSSKPGNSLLYPQKQEDILSINQFLVQTVQQQLVLIKSCCISPHRQTKFGGTDSESFPAIFELLKVDINDFDGVTLEAINDIEDLTELNISIYEIENENDQLVGVSSRRSNNKHSRSVTHLSYQNHICYTKDLSAVFNCFRCENCNTFSRSMPICAVICQFVVKK